MDDRWVAVDDSHVSVVGTSFGPFLSMSTCQEPCRRVSRKPVVGPSIVFLDRSMQSE